jgi:hypothetical protein
MLRVRRHYGKVPESPAAIDDKHHVADVIRTTTMRPPSERVAHGEFLRFMRAFRSQQVPWDRREFLENPLLDEKS